MASRPLGQPIGFVAFSLRLKSFSSHTFLVVASSAEWYGLSRRRKGEMR